MAASESGQTVLRAGPLQLEGVARDRRILSRGRRRRRSRRARGPPAVPSGEQQIGRSKGGDGGVRGDRSSLRSYIVDTAKALGPAAPDGATGSAAVSLADPRNKWSAR